jgi:hypothetical protein
MRRLLLIAAVTVLAAGCTGPCQELGDRLCKCGLSGTTTETCKRQVSNSVGTSIFDNSGPTNAQEAACSDYLDSCNAPAGASFCDWVATSDGKAACGLAY